MERLGEVRVEDLVRDESWFQLGYDLFSFDDAESYRALAGVDGLEALAFIGTWCGDTHDHFPGFVRIWDALKLPRAQLRAFALDRAKTFPGGTELIARHGITRLPTFVLLREGVEIGRITEAPERSLLHDLARLVH